MSSIGWVYYSHNGKLYALKSQQNSWCELWGWAGRREGRHSVLVIEKKNVNGVLNLDGNFKALNQWLEGRARALCKTQQTKEKGLSLQCHYLQRTWNLRTWNLPGWENFNFGSRDLEISLSHCLWLKSLTVTATAPQGTELKAPINEEKEMLRMIWAREEKQK